MKNLIFLILSLLALTACAQLPNNSTRPRNLPNSGGFTGSEVFVIDHPSYSTSHLEGRTATQLLGFIQSQLSSQTIYLNDLEDVEIGSAIKNDVIMFDGISTYYNKQLLSYDNSIDILNYNNALSFSISDSSITGSKLATSNSPATDQILSWDGANLTWINGGGTSGYDFWTISSNPNSYEIHDGYELQLEAGSGMNLVWTNIDNETKKLTFSSTSGVEEAPDNTNNYVRSQLDWYELTLSKCGDVDVTASSGGQFLQKNISTGEWQGKDLYMDDILNADVAGASDGDVQIFNSGNWENRPLKYNFTITGDGSTTLFQFNFDTFGTIGQPICQLYKKDGTNYDLIDLSDNKTSIRIEGVYVKVNFTVAPSNLEIYYLNVIP